MLSRLDKRYISDAVHYFQVMIADQDYLQTYPGFTLLHFACAEDIVWSRIQAVEHAYFDSAEFETLCSRLETRILTRCAGLVEIDEHRRSRLEGLQKSGYNDIYASQDDQNVCRHLRDIRFIHQTAVEFLRAHQEFFHNPQWLSTAALTIVRGKVGVASLAPITRKITQTATLDFTFDVRFFVNMLNVYPRMKAFSPIAKSLDEIDDTAIRTVSQTYDLLNRVNTKYNEAGHEIFTYFSFNAMQFPGPFRDALGFAAFCGRDDYIARYSVPTKRSDRENSYILTCALTQTFCQRWEIFEQKDETLSITMRLLRIIMDALSHLSDSNILAQVDNVENYSRLPSRWSMFIISSLNIINNSSRQRSKDPTIKQRQDQAESYLMHLWKKVIALLLKHRANQIVIWSQFLEPARFSAQYVTVELILEETILPYLSRMIDVAAHGNLLSFKNDVEDLLRPYSDCHQRNIHSIRFKDRRGAKRRDANTRLGFLRLTESQSERLLKVFNLKDATEASEYGPRMDIAEPPPAEADAKTEKLLTEVIADMRKGATEASENDLARISPNYHLSREMLEMQSS